MIERITVVEFRIDNGGRNGAGCFEVKVWADTANFTNVIVARFRKCSDLVREGKVFVKVTIQGGRLSGLPVSFLLHVKYTLPLRAEWVAVREQSCILDSSCLGPMRRNAVLEELRVRSLAVIQEEIYHRLPEHVVPSITHKLRSLQPSSCFATIHLRDKPTNDTVARR